MRHKGSLTNTSRNVFMSTEVTSRSNMNTTGTKIKITARPTRSIPIAKMLAKVYTRRPERSSNPFYDYSKLSTLFVDHISRVYSVFNRKRLRGFPRFKCDVEWAKRPDKAVLEFLVFECHIITVCFANSGEAKITGLRQVEIGNRRKERHVRKEIDLSR